MADTITGPEVLQENDKRVTLKIVVESDGDGSTTVFFDSSARLVNGAASLGTLQRIWYSCSPGDGSDSFARLDFEDSDGDRPLLGLTGAAYWILESLVDYHQARMLILMVILILL